MTVAPNKTSFAVAEIEDSFDGDFGVYDLTEFLGVMSIFSDPELEFNKNNVTIREGKRRIKYLPADPEVLIYPKKEPKFTDNPDAEFTLDAVQIQQIMKASSVLKSGIVTIRGDGKTISVIVHDKTNPNSNQFIIDTDKDTKHLFDMHIKVENLKLIHESYNVMVSSSKVVKFVGDKKSYTVACETDSSFE